MIEDEIQRFYDLGRERGRLAEGDVPALEYVRTLDLLARLLPRPPARILDVGGGPGTYAAALAGQGYEVTLVDPVERHVEEARRATRESGHAFAAALGDARSLAEPDDAFDAVLLLGPLYHLTDRGDRLLALGEARRVARPGGRLLALGIPRFHSFVDGIRRDVLADATFAEIAASGYRTGEHRNPAPQEHPEWFTTAYYHYPDELVAEVEAAGLHVDEVVSVLGPGFMNELRWAELPEAERDAQLEAIRLLEREPSLLGMSDFLVVARVP
jgi:SAM-dependent methyltransferase